MERTDKGRRARYAIVLISLLAVFVALVCLSALLGSVRASVPDTLRALLAREGDDTLTRVIWKIRLPRMLAGILLGGALALSGFLLQTFFNNPIAGPYVLGISSGAKLTVALVMVLVLGANRSVGSVALIAAAFAGAMLSMGFVLLISQKMRRSAALIVSGVMLGYIFTAITDFIVTFADDASIVNLHNWSRGSFSGVSWSDVRVMAAVVLATSLLVFLLSKPIGAYQLGEPYAQSMGVNVGAFRVALVLLSSVLSACVTAFAGPISFVGIAVPHLVKALLNTSRPLLVVPMCFLGGAVFCLGCDLIARTLFSPLELSISSVTAVFGAPVVIAVMLKRRAGD
ncbi:MAG: iron ABC transporter permease [Christensenellaceae bacterium]|nr:iron ABC transporter permease [Christensenellaceae bacterium]MEA5067800.1 iron ABC transporter permease [Christensenellaceae bacterium]